MANLDIMNAGNMFAERYELIRLLGRGGFSEVWLARDMRTEAELAIKVYATSGGLDSEGVKMFTQEFSVVTGINHTNLLRPTYFDEWNGIPYLTLPYCKQGSAFKYLAPGNKITEHECWQMLHDVASGLAYLHSKNPVIIHQDIKPDNILINDEGEYMITDFGISKRIRRTFINVAPNDDEYSSGTQMYMGPERFGTDRRPALANDIWSLGAMMFELMAGYAPFGDQGGLLQKNGAEVPIIHDEEYSEELKHIVYMCLSLERHDRPTAKQLADYSDLRIKEISMEDVVKKQSNTFTESLSRTLSSHNQPQETATTEAAPTVAVVKDTITSEPEPTVAVVKDTITREPEPTVHAVKHSSTPKQETVSEPEITPVKPFWQSKKFLILISVVVCILIALFVFQRCQNTESPENIPEPADTILSDTVNADTAKNAAPIDSTEQKKADTPAEEPAEKEEPTKLQPKPATPIIINNTASAAAKPDTKPAPKSKGELTVSGATYSGEIANGKPNGKGELRFNSAQTFQKLSVQAGYVAKGTFENGRLVIGKIYDENGVVKHSIVY